MSDDIVQRLRRSEAVFQRTMPGILWADMHEAADEIERLRATIRGLAAGDWEDDDEQQ